MFRDGLRAFQRMSDENYLPVLSPNCHHKVDSIVLNLSGLSITESNYLIEYLSRSSFKEFEIAQMRRLNPSAIRELAGGSFTHSLILWALLKRLLTYHARDCDGDVENAVGYVEVEGLQTLHGDVPLSELELSVRSLNVLKREGIHSAYQLSAIPRSELLAMQNLGTNSVSEIVALLETMGLQHDQGTQADSSSTLTGAVSLNNLGLSTRTYNGLKRIGVENLSQLSALSYDDLRDIRNFGEKSITEISALLDGYSLTASREENFLSSVDEAEIDQLYIWARECIKTEIEFFGTEILKYYDLKVEYKSSEKSLDTFGKHKNHMFYADCRTLSDVIYKFRNDLAKVESFSSLDKLILNLDSFNCEFRTYQDNCLNVMPTKAQKKSLLDYEQEYSNQALEPLKLDESTLHILGFSTNDSIAFLQQNTFFEFLDVITECFITESRVWDIVKSVTSFHEKYDTFPNALGVLARTIRGLRPNKAERDFRILLMRIDGATLDEIGTKESLTRERVRQVLKKISPELISAIEAIRISVQGRHEVLLEENFRNIFNTYGAIYKSELALEVGANEEDVINQTPRKYRKFIIDKTEERISIRAWTKEDCFSSLRLAATYYFPLRQADYEHLINIGEIDGPSIPYMYLRLGQWSKLCFEAGIEFVPTSRSEYVRMWSPEELLSYGRRYFLEPDTPGSLGGFEAWRDEQPDHVPSGALLRSVFGNWTTIRRKVLEGLREEKGLKVRSDV